MKHFLALAFFVGTLPGFGQIRNLNITLGSNISFIPEYRETTVMENLSAQYYDIILYSSYELRRSYDGRAGVSGSMGFEYGISKRFYLVTGLNVDYYRYSVTTALRSLDPTIPTFNTPVAVGTPFGSFYGFQNSVTPGESKAIDSQFVLSSGKPDDVKTYLVGIPIMAGTKFLNDKLSVEAGLNVVTLVRAVTERTGYYFTTEEGTVDSPWRDGPITVPVMVAHEYRYKTKSSEGFNTFQVASIVRTGYRLTNHFDVTVSGQMFLTSLYEKESGRQKSMLLGVRWRW